MIAILGLGALVVIAVLLRSLIAVSLDEEGARVAGLPVPALNGLISVLAALTIGVSMRIVGILLIAALMVLPVIAAQRVAWSVRSTMGLAIRFGLASVLAGLTVSYYGNLPPGGTIVLTGTAVFLAASLVEACPRSGLDADEVQVLVHVDRGQGPVALDHVRFVGCVPVGVGLDADDGGARFFATRSPSPWRRCHR